jgi:prolyl oligopeptidase
MQNIQQKELLMKKPWVSVFLTVLVLAAGCQKRTIAPPGIQYPVTKKVEQVDDYFGVKVADPYRWLEDDTAADVKQWVQAENAVTFDYLGKIPFREKIHARLQEIYNYPRYSAPFRAGDYYFFYKNDGLQNQSVCYIQKGLDGTPSVFLDPNRLSPDGTVRASVLSVSKDNRYAAVSRGEAGSDWSEIRVMEIPSGKELPDVVRWVKFSDAAWRGDGFYYSGFSRPAPGQELQAKNEFQKVFYHKLGEPQDKDVVVLEDKKRPLLYFGADVSEDETMLFLTISEGTSGNALMVQDLTQKKADLELLVKGFEFDSSAIDTAPGGVLVYTNVGAPNYRVVLIDPKNPAAENWKTVIPERDVPLIGVENTAGYLFCGYLQDASSRYYQYNREGSLVREIQLPALGSAAGFGGKRDEKILFYTFTSFTYPPTIYKFNPATGVSEVFRKSEVRFNPDDYETKQVFFTSKDGTRVPMFIVAKKGLERNGKNPALLTGYGGFNISLTPSFNPSNIVLLENGGVFAQPSLRGGGEYGESWHKAGMLLNKKNVFDDFIGAAEYLINEGYTSRDLLAIQGASNGGLLIGAVMTERPDLFRVCIPQVGVMDMLRYQKFTVGWGWVVEYGSSDEEAYFKYLYSYSPLHNLKPGVCYPATLVTTADHDDRVVPAHSFKFAAALQADQSCPNPVLIRIETRSGHGASNVTKAIDLLTDIWSFVFENTGVQPIYK